MDGVGGWSTMTGMGGGEWNHEAIESFGFFPPLSKRNLINVIETWSERLRHGRHKQVNKKAAINENQNTYTIHTLLSSSSTVIPATSSGT